MLWSALPRAKIKLIVFLGGCAGAPERGRTRPQNHGVRWPSCSHESSIRTGAGAGKCLGASQKSGSCAVSALMHTHILYKYVVHIKEDINGVFLIPLMFVNSVQEL